MSEMQRYHWTPDGMKAEHTLLAEKRGHPWVRDEALEAQAEGHAYALKEIHRLETLLTAACREREETLIQHAAEIAEKDEEHRKELGDALNMVGYLRDERSRLGGCFHYRLGAETEDAFAERISACDRCGAKAALRGEGEPALVHYKNARLIGEPCMIHRDFKPMMTYLCHVAALYDVQLWITHSMRRLNQKLFDTVVEAAERSNHHAGSAVDMNPVYEGVWYTSELMSGDIAGLPRPVEQFLADVTASSRLRWGGQFGVNKDRVHIDDNLVLRDPAEWAKRVEQLRGESK